MRSDEINSSSSRLTDSTESSATPGVFKDVAGRALLVIEPEREIFGAAANFRQAPFLAQLIATKDKHPQTRERRRAHPADAIGAYRAVEAMVEEKAP
jgi:hypothetical protein